VYSFLATAGLLLILVSLLAGILLRAYPKAKDFGIAPPFQLRAGRVLAILYNRPDISFPVVMGVFGLVLFTTGGVQFIRYVVIPLLSKT
jgi:hypothetical protein